MGIVDRALAWVGLSVSHASTALASAQEAIPAPHLAAPIGGLSVERAGFMDGTDGRQSTTWARYASPVFGAGHLPSGGWGAYWGTPGAEISRDRAVAASVSTDLLTSNSTIATLVENFATYAIGTGLTLSARPDHEALGLSPDAGRALAHQIERAWLAWATNPVECDASSRHTVHQLATAAFKSWLLTGETVFLLDWLRGNGAQTATKVKLLDARQVDQAVSRVEDRGNVLQGVQFDKTGRLAGYWIRPFVLGNTRSAPQPIFVRARTSWGRPRAVHLFDLLVPGQVRGLSPLIAALTPSHSKGTLREFALLKALVESMIAATVESDLPADQALRALQTDDDGLQSGPSGVSPDAWINARDKFYDQVKINLQPGVVTHMMAGDKLRLHRAESPNSTYDAFDKSLGREAAKAAGASAEDVSGYFGDTSFAASRLAMELPSRINKRRRSAIVEPFYQNIFAAWLEEACETGAIKLPEGAPAFWEAPQAYCRAVWRGEGKPVSDPLKQAQADLLELTNGLSTYEAKLGERGLDLEEVIAQRKAEREMFEAAGLTYPAPQSSAAQQEEDGPAPK